jgi:hypothetical protein
VAPNPQLPEELLQAFDPERIVYLHSGHRTVEEYAEALTMDLILLLKAALNIRQGDLEPEDFAGYPLIWDLIQQLTYNEVVAKDQDTGDEDAR